ncbi:MAG TPA: hypothetical protein VFZ98_05955, partial [Vicinamibacterales bacterium]
GAATELRGIIAARQGDRAPLEALNMLIDIEERRNERPEFVATLDDLVKRYSSDPRVPGFLLRHAEGAMLKQNRPGHVMYARELARRVVETYPNSPEAVGANALLKEMNARPGRGGGGG